MTSLGEGPGLPCQRRPHAAGRQAGTVDLGNIFYQCTRNCVQNTLRCTDLLRTKKSDIHYKIVRRSSRTAYIPAQRHRPIALTTNGESAPPAPASKNPAAASAVSLPMILPGPSVSPTRTTQVASGITSVASPTASTHALTHTHSLRPATTTTEKPYS